ncbi:MAG: hypothetical protein V3W14_12325 [Candidatus Neomarinimicrobiota bacterium]
MDLGAMIIALFTALVVKIVVMVLAFWLVLKVYQSNYPKTPRRLWLLVPREHLPQIKILWWSLVLFFFAEFTCGVEVYIITRSSALLAGIHSVVSGIGTALFALGIYLYLDQQLIRFGQPTCLANRICQGCTINETEGCKFRVIGILMATFVGLAAILPFFAPTEQMMADTRKFILPFDSINLWFDSVVEPWIKVHFPAYRRTGIAYHLPASMFIIEFRILPTIVLGLAVTGIRLLMRRKELLGFKITSFAFGMLCYIYLEIILYPATGEVLIGSLGHEVVELWFLLITAEFLRRSFSPDAQAQAGKAGTH